MSDNPEEVVPSPAEGESQPEAQSTWSLGDGYQSAPQAQQGPGGYGNPNAYQNQPAFAQPGGNAYGQQGPTSYQSANAYAGYGGYQGAGFAGGGFPGGGNPHPINPIDLPLYNAGFGAAVSRFFKKFVTFTGRASRSEYWWVMLFQLLIQIIPMILLFIALVGFISSGYNDFDNYVDSPEFASSIVTLLVAGIMYLVISLVFIIPTLALGWRRMHDVNIPGAVYLLSYVPMFSIVPLVIALMAPEPQGARFDQYSTPPVQ